MKKKVLAAGAAVAIAAAAVINMDFASGKEERLSDIQLANIEALALRHLDDDKTTCYNTITSRDGVKTLFCGSCSYVNNSEPTTFSGSGTCP